MKFKSINPILPVSVYIILISCYKRKYKEFATEVAIKRFVYKFGERHLSKKTHLNIIIPYVSYETKLC